jgi:hypothetical protein
VPLPLLLVLAERAFCLPSWSALRARWRFHAVLAASWLVLLACVALGPTNPTVGYHTIPRASAVEWLLTQTHVLPHYVGAVFAPVDLRGMYDLATMGVLLHARGRTEEAVPFLRRALELRPGFAAEARHLGIAWLALGRPADASPCLAPLLEQAPGDPVLQQLVAAARHQLPH